MHKLAAVEEAVRLMTEAKGWSVWQWLTDKRRIRTAASGATAALDKAEKKVKAEWPDHVRKLDRQIEAGVPLDDADPLHRAVAGMKKADDEAYTARMDAAAAFDEAERRGDVALFRGAAQKALDAYSLHERAIRIAEGLATHRARGV